MWEATGFKDRVYDGRSQVRNWIRKHGLELTRTNASLLGLHLDQLFDKYGVDLVLDVGAHNGEYGRFLRRNGYKGRIVSFEPVSSNLDILRHRASNDACWTVEPIALGSQEGTTDINVTHFSVFASFRQPSTFAHESFGDAVEIVETQSVKVRRLDSVWSEVVGAANSVHLKIDTQGWDLEVLKGATGCLASVATLQTEVSLQAVYEGSPPLSESLDSLAQFGFSPSGFFPVSSQPNGSLIEMDCVAVRADREIRRHQASERIT